MVFAQDEAQRLGHRFIAPEHIALGIIRNDEDSPKLRVRSRGRGRVDVSGLFDALGLDAEALRGELIEAAHGIDRAVGAEFVGAGAPFTESSKTALELSLKEALQLGQRFIAPGHILLGLLAKREPTVLVDKLDIERTRQLVATRSAFERRAETRRPSRTAGFDVVTRAAEAAAGGQRVGTQHLLVAMVSPQDTLAGRVLTQLGVTEEKVQELIGRLGTEGTLDAPPQPEYELRVGEHIIRVDDPQSRDMLRRVLDDDPDLAERIAAAIERRKQEGAN